MAHSFVQPACVPFLEASDGFFPVLSPLKVGIEVSWKTIESMCGCALTWKMMAFCAQICDLGHVKNGHDGRSILCALAEHALPTAVPNHHPFLVVCGGAVLCALLALCSARALPPPQSTLNVNYPSHRVLYSWHLYDKRARTGHHVTGAARQRARWGAAAAQRAERERERGS